MSLSTVRNQLKVFERNLREGPGLHKGQHPQPDQVPKGYVREAEKNQHAHQDSGSHSIQEEGMTRYQYCNVLFAYQPTIDTFDTVNSSFIHLICG